MFNKGNMAKMLKQAQDVQKRIEHVQSEWMIYRLMVNPAAVW